MDYWTYLLLLMVGATGSLAACLKQFSWKKGAAKKAVKRGVVLGVSLAVFDWVFETWGAGAGYWSTAGSAFFIGAVPFEVSLIALCTGMTYHWIFPKKFSWLLAVSSSVVIAVVGAGVEASLNEQKLLVYAGGWTSVHAFASYFLAFLGMYLVNAWLNSRRSLTPRP